MKEGRGELWELSSRHTDRPAGSGEPISCCWPAALLFVLIKAPSRAATVSAQPHSTPELFSTSGPSAGWQDPDTARRARKPRYRPIPANFATRVDHPSPLQKLAVDDAARTTKPRVDHAALATKQRDDSRAGHPPLAADGTPLASSVHPDETNDTDRPQLPGLPLPKAPDPLDLRLIAALQTDIGFRHRGWRPLRVNIARALHAIWPYSPRVERFLNCGSNAWVMRHPDHPDEFRVGSDTCNDRWCIPCARTRGHLIASNLSRAVRGQRTRLVTLTLASGDTPLMPLLAKLNRCFRLLRRTPIWKRCVTGGAAIIEVVRGRDRNRWHPHLHVLVHGTYLPHAALKQNWLELTGDSDIVDIRPVRSENDLARYVTKYISKAIPKGAMQNPELLQELIEALHKKRLLTTFGSWRGIQLLDRGEPIDWQFVGRLFVLRSKARDGDSDSMHVLQRLHYWPTVDVDEHPEPTLDDP